ncbi:hypothetical protein R6Q59_013217 [Mikania micrantha]
MRGSETTIRLFTFCYAANIVWQFVSSWCKMQPIFVFSIQVLLEIHRSANGEHLKRKAIHVVILTAIWCLWRSRNERIFKGRRVSILSLKEEIKSLSFL